MNARILILAIVLGAVDIQSSPSVSAQTSPNTVRNFRLRINAAAGDAVHVCGAVWMGGSNTNVVIVDQQTPIEMGTYGSAVNGILKVDGRDRIRVQVTDETNGTPTLSAEGHAIIVGQGLAPNSGWAFVRTEQ
jgi:hypothetical protein